MVYLILNIVLSSSFILLIRWSQVRKLDVYTVGATNYIVAGLTAVMMIVPMGHPGAVVSMSGFWGAINGLGYFIAFFFLVHVAHWKGAALTAVISRLSILLAVVCGIVIWGESPCRVQAAGIVIACPALLLVGGRDSATLSVRLPWQSVLAMLCLFLAAGSSRVAQEAFKHMCRPDEWMTYVLAAFGLTAVMSVVMLIVRRRRPRIMEIVTGTLIGLANIFQVQAILAALAIFEGFVVFPVTMAGGVILTVAVSALLLNERISRRSYIGIGLGILSVILLNFTGK